MKAKVVRLSEIGADSTLIRSYIVNAYNTWTIRPEYLLLVGNKYQIPFPRFVHPGSITSYSDNYYANVTGDFHNELYHGRFWVTDTLQAKTIVAKVLGYEKNPSCYLDSSWFRKGVTIVNEYEPPPPSDSVYWADARYAHALMNSVGFVHIDSFAYSYGDSSLDVVSAINDGRSYIIYRGVGFGVWEWPFMNIFPDQMNNGFRLPIVISGTCATIEGIGQFWLSSGTPEQPKGIIGFFGTTTALMQAAEMRSALTKGTLESIFRDSTSTLGKAAESGRLKYYELFGNTLEYHSWNCLGDPEMTIWTKTPKELMVGHNTFFATGICTATVYVLHNAAPVVGALVCVMAKRDSSFYHYGYTNQLGHIQFIDTLHFPCDSVYITVTGSNLRTYHNARPVYYSDGPYVTLNSFRLSDSLGGNQDGIVNPAEDIEIPFGLKNWGNATAHGVTVIVQEAIPDTLCVLYDTIRYIGDMAPLELLHVGPNGFNVVIDSCCPDLHPVELRLRISDSGTSSWISDFDFTVHAPIISYRDYYFPENKKYISEGDTSILFLELMNVGSYQAANIIGTLTCSDSFVTIIDSTVSFGTIPADSLATNQTDPFVISTSPTTPPCHTAQLTLRLVSGAYAVCHDFTILVGQKDYLVWDPDPNHSSGPIIHACLAQLNFLGDYRETFPFRYLNIYKSMFICLGMSPYKHIIYDTSMVVPEIEQFLYAGGPMYLEGGDVWYLDPSVGGHSFASDFCVSAVWNSFGPCPNVSGTSGTFTEGMYFNYHGEASSMDRIESIGSGMVVFTNALNGYGCGVAANNRTVGLSFELGGLADTIPPSTKAGLLDSIMSYFGILPTAIEESKSLNNMPVLLLACQPNPFRNNMKIRFSVLDTGCSTEKHTLVVYDAAGRVVRTLSQASSIQNQQSEVIWDGTDDKGRSLAQGVYFVHLETQGELKTIKAILLR